jgi:hypothetical protein
MRMWQAIKDFFEYDECPWGNRAVYMVHDFDEFLKFVHFFKVVRVVVPFIIGFILGIII